MAEDRTVWKGAVKKGACIYEKDSQEKETWRDKKKEESTTTVKFVCAVNCVHSATDYVAYILTVSLIDSFPGHNVPGMSGNDVKGKSASVS